MKRTITILLFSAIMAVGAFAQEKPKPETKPTETKQPAAQAKPAEQMTAMPTADQIIEKYVQAIGGKAAIEKVTSRVTKGTIEIPAMGANGTTESYAKAPNKFVNVADISGLGAFQQGYTGTVAWSQDPFSGLRDLTGAELSMVKREAELHGDLKIKEHYPKLVVKGKEKVGEREAYVLEGTTAEGSIEKLYFDTQTGLILRKDSEVDSPMGKVPTEFYLEDYREVDGLKMPFTIRQSNPNVTFTIKITDVKHNVAIDDAKFNKPAAK